jgi:glycosyltransferase involved in cell wall biosynthesis
MGENDNILVTFVIFSYNQERYIADAVFGALAQTYSPLEIIISDDCSTDRTFEIVQSIARDYKGPHILVLNRNTKNLHIGEHVNKVAGLVRGQFVVLAGGDDISLPSRTQHLFNKWISLGGSSVVLYSDFFAIDAGSNLIELDNEEIYRGCFLIENMARGDIRVLGATAAISQDLFSSFSPFSSNVIHEDRVFPFRAMLMGGQVMLLDQKLVMYRTEGGISRHLFISNKVLLKKTLPDLWLRTLPDAIQRLSDVKSYAPNNLGLIKACQKTVIDYNAWIALSQASCFAIEVYLIKWLYKGARRCALLKLYCKLRFIMIYDRD